MGERGENSLLQNFFQPVPRAFARKIFACFSSLLISGYNRGRESDCKLKNQWVFEHE